MTTHDKDKIIAAAKLCGYWNGQTIEMNDVGIERFYTIAFEDGRQAEREACIDIVETYKVSVGNSRSGELVCEWTMENLREIRDTIRARGEGK